MKATSASGAVDEIGRADVGISRDGFPSIRGAISKGASSGKRDFACGRKRARWECPITRGG